MIDIQLLRSNPEKIKEGAAAKGYDASVVAKVIEADNAWRETLQKVEHLRAERNKVAKERNIEEGKRIKQELQKLEPELEKLEEEVNALVNQIPNLPDDNAPRGKGGNENVETKKWGEIPSFNFEPKNHLELGEALGLLD